MEGVIKEKHEALVSVLSKVNMIEHKWHISGKLFI